MQQKINKIVWKDMPVPALQIIEHPNEILSTPSKAVVIDSEFEKWLVDFKYLYDYIRGIYGLTVVGMAAPQAGKNIRCFFVNDKLYINPEIIWTTKAPDDFEPEGCLSLPMGKSWNIKRSPSITIKFQNLNGEWEEERFNSLNARAVQHELDHLDGKLCCGDISNLEDSNK
jgi:peptide deformylase